MKKQWIDPVEQRATINDAAGGVVVFGLGTCASTRTQLYQVGLARINIAFGDSFISWRIV